MVAALSLTALAAACGGAAPGKATAAAGVGDGGAVLKIKDPGNAGPLAVAKKEGIHGPRCHGDPAVPVSFR
ncbi:hypothetical protein GCM10023075_63660 [Streptosporangium album]